VVRAGSRKRFFVNGVGIGFTAMVDVESTRIRSLRGLPLYALALFKATVRHFVTPPMTVRLDDRETTGPTLTVSVALGQREGGFPLLPDARIDDGWFDYLHAGRVRRWDVVRYFPAMVRGKLPTDHPHLHIGRCRQAAVRADTPLCAHADGELVSRAGDGVTTVEVDLLPARLKVQVCPAFRPGGKTKTPAGGPAGGAGRGYD
jgi:diacylglycerol kinase family enzyme